MALNYYQKNIVQGKSFLVVAILMALITRLATCFYFDFEAPLFLYSEGYLWNAVSFIFEDKLVSVLASALSVGAIAFLLSFINGKFIIIRKKTMLPSAFSLVLLSVHPSFMFMGAHYLGIITILLAISFLFQSYQTDNRQKATITTSFILAIGSLFFFNLIFYFVIFWIGLSLMRSFGFKSLLAFFIGLFLIYTPVFTYYLVFDDLDRFLLPFVRLSAIEYADLPLLHFNIQEWIALGFGFLLLLLFFANNYVNSFKDKIKIRSFISFLSIICIVSVLFLLFFNVDAVANFYVYTGISSLLFAHYFALNEHKATQILFYAASVFYLIITIVFFFSF